jgi:purine nucleosidase
MLRYYDRHDIARYGAPGGPLHDPCVIAWLLQPDLFRGRQVHLAVETDSTLTRGRTVADWWGITGEEPNATVMDGVNSDGFYTLIVDRLSRL